MKKIIYLIFVFISSAQVFGQIENVPLDHPVYKFIKEMKIKGIINQIHDDAPNLSRVELQKFLTKIEAKKSKLSDVEIQFLDKYKTEFFYDLQNPENTTELLRFERGAGKNAGEIFSQKLKYLYTYRSEDINLFSEFHGHYRHGQAFKPKINNAEIYDLEFNFHGTFLKDFGYNFAIRKGQAKGNRSLAELVFPELQSNLKWEMNQEETSNFDFTSGYIKYEKSPRSNMLISVELGREKLKYGYGYSESLIYSGNSANMDFLRFRFSWGIMNFISTHGTMPGRYSTIRIADRYTKHIALNKLSFTFPDLFSVGIGEAIVYGNRGMELGYLNPFIFYKFVEHSMQDRDNGVLFFDFQSDFIKGLELEATVLIDETLDIFDPEKFTNKTAYQIGAMTYSPFNIPNFSFAIEYTLIRPYVYTHTMPYNTYSSWEQPLGHSMGPNSDQIYINAAYNFSNRIRLELNYQMLRRGENIYDSAGNLVKNVGGDMFVPYDLDLWKINDRAVFLEGERFNDHKFGVWLRIEPVREIYFDFAYQYQITKNIEQATTTDKSFGMIRMLVWY